ncbi:hypothetical protein GQ457_13G018500 [Hibiscus cannabinus]
MDILRGFVKEAKNENSSRNATPKFQQQKGIPIPPQLLMQPITNKITSYVHGKARTKAAVDESGGLCELKYGSYCIWHEENREAMQDSMVKKLKDQLLWPGPLVSVPDHLIYPWPTGARFLCMILKISEWVQHLGGVLLSSNFSRLVRCIVVAVFLFLTVFVTGLYKSQRMEAVIARAKSVTLNCNNVDKKLRQIFDLTEDEANFHMKQSAFLYQFAVQTMPKSQHCLSMRLTVEYFGNHSFDKELSGKYCDPKLQHYVLYSPMISLHHQLNTFKDAVVQVLNIEDYYDKAALSQQYIIILTMHTELAYIGRNSKPASNRELSKHPAIFFLSNHIK